MNRESKRFKPAQSFAIPPEIWLEIHSHFPPWAQDPCMLLKLSSICKSARIAFLSDCIWKRLNPYGLNDSIAKNFLDCVASLDPIQRRNLFKVWSQSSIVQSKRNHEESLQHYQGDSIAYLLAKKALPGLNEHENLYYELGVILATSHLMPLTWSDDGRIVAQRVDNRQLLLIALKIDYYSYFRASDTLRKDLEVVRTLLSLNGELFQHVDIPVTKELALIACGQTIRALLNRNIQTFRTDEEVVLTALADDQQCKFLLFPFPIASYIGPELMRNEHFLRTAIPLQCSLLEHSPPSLLQDREFIKKVISVNANAMQYVLPSMRLDRELWLTAARSGSRIMHAPEEIRDDAEVIFEAMKYCIGNCCLASTRLKRSPEFIKKILYYGREFYLVFPESLTKDREYVLNYTKYANPYTSHEFLEAIGNFNDDDEIIRSAVRKQGHLFQYASKRLRDDSVMAALAVSSYGYALAYASPRLRNSKDLVLKAVRANGCALVYASDTLKEDEEVITAAITNNGLALGSAPSQFYNPEMALRSYLSLEPHRFDQEFGSEIMKGYDAIEL